jgi:hypothetical protein
MSDAYTDRLLDLAYGELPKREAREVEAHAASCDACRAELARIRGTRRAMAALPEEPAPERGERILLAAAREAAGRRRPRRLVPRWLLGGAVVAASIAVVAAVSYRVAGWSPRRDDPNALLGESRYAAPPPAASSEAAPSAAAPAPAGPGERDTATSAPRTREPTRIAAAPAPAPRREPAPAARPAEGLGAFASPPPASADSAPAGAAEVEAREGLARAERYVGERSEAPAAAAAPPRPMAAPSRAPAAPPPAAAVGSQERAAPTQMRKSAAAPQASLGYEGSQPGDASPPRVQVRTFPGCEGEAVRRVEVDPSGRTVRYVREGKVGGRRLRVEHAFGPDGRPAGVTVTDLDAPGAALDARALGLSLPARAEDAGIDAPPRCGR